MARHGDVSYLCSEQLGDAVQYWSRQYGHELSSQSVVELMRAISEYLQWLREIAENKADMKGGNDAPSSST